MLPVIAAAETAELLTTTKKMIVGFECVD